MIGVIGDKPHPTFYDAVKLVQLREKSISEISEAFDKERVEVWNDDDVFTWDTTTDLKKERTLL